MAQTEESLKNELKEVEQQIAVTEGFRKVTELNIKAIELKRELGLPLNN